MNDLEIRDLSAADLSVLFGVSETAVLAAAPFSTVPWNPPADWMRTARRRAREAMAHTSSTDIPTCIDYLRGVR